MVISLHCHRFSHFLRSRLETRLSLICKQTEVKKLLNILYQSAYRIQVSFGLPYSGGSEDWRTFLGGLEVIKAISKEMTKNLTTNTIIEAQQKIKTFINNQLLFISRYERPWRR